MSKFPNYVEDIDHAAYEYGAKAMNEPFWWGNIMYNETALFVDDGTEISASLRYQPLRVISVRDNTLKIEYKEGEDYVISNNKLLWKTGSKIGYWTKKQLVGTDPFPSPYLKKDSISNTLTDYVPWNGVSVYTESPIFYGTQVSVTYAYDVKDLDLTKLPSYSLDKLPHIKAKLAAHDDVVIATTGDSIAAGCSSSNVFHHEPYMDPFVPSFCGELEKRFSIKITNANQSIGGKTSDWGSEDPTLNSLVAVKPDLVFVHFGVNDLGAGSTPNHYADNIEKIILTINSAVPNCDIVLFSPIAPNPDIYDYERMEKYVDKLSVLSNEYSCLLLDVFNASQEAMKNKKYFDATGNGINHPNDFGHRLYVGSLLSAFISLK